MENQLESRPTHVFSEILFVATALHVVELQSRLQRKGVKRLSFRGKRGKP
jgi:hypothetical protein